MAATANRGGVGGRSLFFMIQPFEVVSVDFNWWILKRIEKDEDWTWFEAIWLRNEKDIRI